VGMVGVVLDAIFGYFVVLVVGGVFSCRSLSGFLVLRGPRFYQAIS
jgi:hypothetical protein